MQRAISGEGVDIAVTEGFYRGAAIATSGA
jgi:hypothetical protein